ncbi:hypothetical protein PCASD_10315 [Puccinia coronata f. sp. avenae]|uniref:CxC1-like cysteine cluster associated with KDZ transposases domain-containing protein n=1 Tax=Puccinia coronata f. sp. avenae TaxID=200324 RepID=A0A2N5U7I4_9BASI|nr:hypothetical protein PCASD_10315 [Puccinia coronata f. sp. avenae]
MRLTVAQRALGGTRAQRLRRMRQAKRIYNLRASFYGRGAIHRRGFVSVEAHGDSNPDDFHREDIITYTTTEEDAYNNPDWITLDDGYESDEFDHAVRSEREKWRQEAKKYNWNTIINSLHAYYMDLKIRTDNWTDNKAYGDYTKCTCPDDAIKCRVIDLVDVYAQRRTEFDFCKCTSDPLRLLQRGFIAASPVKPQTAFSLPLLAFHNALWNHGHVGAQPFTLAITEWLEPRLVRLFARKKKHARHMRKPFSSAVDLYRKLEKMSDELVFSALELTPQQILASESCAACFGPQPPNHHVYSDSTQDKLIVCLDGNFQHRHHIKASRDYEPLETPRIFLPSSEFTEMRAIIRAKEIELCPPAKADRCADSHKAADDKRNESTWKGCDDTGLMGCCCRHDAAIYVGNIYKSDEQRCLPVAMIKRLLTDCEANRRIGVLYDIGCSLDKYMQARDLLGEDQARITFGTSVFHAYVHNWLCQLDYHPRLNNGWGLSDGEGLERLWSYLSALYHNMKGQSDLPKWLKRKFLQATKRRNKAKLTLAGLSEITNPHTTSPTKYGSGFFKRQWEDQCAFQKSHTEAEEERRAKLVTLYKQEAVVELLRQRLQGPEVFLATEQEVVDLLNAIANHSDDLTQQRKELTRERGMRAVMDDEESKLLLLLWDAKAKLFVQAVHIQSEKRPITDSKTLGNRLGTKLKEKIFKSLQTRRPAVKKHIDAYNRRYEEYVSSFPDQTLSDAADYPLTYEEFAAFPLDHRFWNDGLYYHSKAPWAIDPNVRAGITAVLTLERVQEEFNLIAQEVCRAMGWGAEYYDQLKTVMSRLLTIHKRGDAAELRKEDAFVDHIPLFDFGVSQKCKVIYRELRRRRLSHGIMMDEWSGNLTWLWERCQPFENRGFIAGWNTMLQEIRSGNDTDSERQMVVDEELEDVVLEDVDDGEYVDMALIDQTEYTEWIDGAAGEVATGEGEAI